MNAEHFDADHIHTTPEGRHFRHGDGQEVDGGGTPIVRMSDQMRAKVDTVFAAHVAWQRGEINEREYLRRADITDGQHTEIERGLSRYADRSVVLVRIANILYPV